MPEPQWFTKQAPNGEWYKTQANSPEEAIAKMSKAWGPSAAPINRGPAYDPPSRSDAAIGRMVPEGMTGALSWAQQHYVDPMNRYLQRVREAGREFGRDLLGEGADPNVQKKFGMQGDPTLNAALNATGKAGETVAPIVADPRNWPLMGTGGFVKGLVGAEIGSRVGAGTAKHFGGGEATQGLSGLVGGSLGAAAGAGPEFLREHYQAVLENTKADLRAGRGYGARLDEGQVQKAAEQIVEKAAAQANTPEQLMRTARDITLTTLKAGLMMGGNEKDVPQKFGEHAQPIKPDMKPPLTADEVRSRITTLEATTRPVTPVERVQQMAAPKTLAEIPPVTKFLTPEMLDRIIKPEPAPNKGPTPEQELAGLRAQRAQELTDLKAMVAERRAQNPKVAAEFDKRGQGVPPEGATRLEAKQAEMKAKNDVINSKQAEAEQFIREHRRQQATEATRLQQENDALRKASSSPEVGGVPAPTQTTKPAAEPVPPAKETPRSREPVRPAAQPEVGSEPRSLRGDLGERPSAATKPTPRDFAKDMEGFKQRVTDYQEKNPGVSKQHAATIIAEQMRKERGSLGGSPDDPQARREAKINEWLNQLKDEKTPPAVLDNAYKMLGAYGLSHDDIIQRMAGGADFAKSPIEERLGPNPELDKKADSMIGGLMNTVDRVMGDAGITQRSEFYSKEKFGEVGSPEIPTVKDAGREELERMFKLRDERGSLSFRRLPPKPQRTGANALDDLTAKLESSMRAVPPDDSRMRIAERLDQTITEGWDKVQISLGKIAAQAVALKDMYMREPELTDYRTAVGRFSGSLNRSAWELRQFTKAIKEKLPDQRRREAVTNYIQAGGDDQVLADRAARSKGSLRAGYEAARTLTTDEKGLASFIVNHFDRRLKDAINLGILKDGLENYVPQMWKAKDQQQVASYFSSLHRGGLLKPDFNAAKHRIFDSYFDGEQAGRVPINKDIGFLVASWDRAFNQALASRSLIRDLTKGLAKDGRPIVAPSGVGKTVFDSGSASPTEGEKPESYFIYPKAAPDETGDYRALNHSALQKWTWATKDDNGAPIFVKGDLRVHPDHAQTLDNVINRGKWAEAHPVQTAILKGQGFFKATLLSMSPFHQIQEGTHALFHKVNPFSPGQIDLTNPTLNKLLDRGLVIGNYDPVAAFDEGLTAAGGGLIGKIPGIGRFQQKYSEYLFQDYIPRLKAKMATEAYERNIKHYAGHISAGDITTDQIAELTANQANAAFGELNYVTMGRSPQTQAILRMMFLAPDFLEARVRFAAQATRPYGREQYAALFRGALGMYTTARILNKLLDDDYHWDKPFSLIAHGYEYKIRSLPGDIWNLMEDPHSFVMHRLNPLLVKQGWEFLSGKDDFGRKRAVGEQVMDAVRSIVPIPTQGLFKGTPEGGIGGLLSSGGITRAKYRTQAGALAHQYSIGSNPNDVTSHHVTELVQDITNGNLDGNKIGKLLIDGKMNPKDLKTAMKLAQMPELYRDYYRLPVELKAKVFAAASPQEKAMLRSLSKRELDTTRLLPEQRAEYMKSFAEQ